MLLPLLVEAPPDVHGDHMSEWIRKAQILLELPRVHHEGGWRICGTHCKPFVTRLKHVSCSFSTTRPRFCGSEC